MLPINTILHHSNPKQYNQIKPEPKNHNQSRRKDSILNLLCRWWHWMWGRAFWTEYPCAEYTSGPEDKAAWRSQFPMPISEAQSTEAIALFGTSQNSPPSPETTPHTELVLHLLQLQLRTANLSLSYRFQRRRPSPSQLFTDPNQHQHPPRNEIHHRDIESLPILLCIRNPLDLSEVDDERERQRGSTFSSSSVFSLFQ